MNPPLWQWLVRKRVTLANIGLVLVLVIGSGYLGREVLRFNPFARTFQVTVDLANSGGLLPGDDVTFRGTRVGKVRDVRVSGDGIAAVAAIDAGTKIPMGGTVRVGRLSAAGEQYLDFRPDADTGPYLTDGSTVARSRTSVPVPIQNVLTHMSGLISGMNPDRLDVVINELDKAARGRPGRDAQYDRRDQRGHGRADQSAAADPSADRESRGHRRQGATVCARGRRARCR